MSIAEATLTLSALVLAAQALGAFINDRRFQQVRDLVAALSARLVAVETKIDFVQTCQQCPVRERAPPRRKPKGE